VAAADNKSVAREFNELCLNDARTDRLGEYVSRDVVVHAGTPVEAAEIRGIAELADVVRRTHDVLAGYHVTVLDLVAEGDRVLVRWTVEGTHASEWFGVPATHRPVRFGGMDLYRFDRGLIREWWRNEDHLFLLQQLER
jgi:predicted ester cyclase